MVGTDKNALLFWLKPRFLISKRAFSGLITPIFLTIVLKYQEDSLVRPRFFPQHHFEYPPIIAGIKSIQGNSCSSAGKVPVP